MFSPRNLSLTRPLASVPLSSEIWKRPFTGRFFPLLVWSFLFNSLRGSRLPPYTDISVFFTRNMVEFLPPLIVDSPWLSCRIEPRRYSWSRRTPFNKPSLPKTLTFFYGDNHHFLRALPLLGFTLSDKADLVDFAPLRADAPPWPFSPLKKQHPERLKDKYEVNGS